MFAGNTVAVNQFVGYTKLFIGFGMLQDGMQAIHFPFKCAFIQEFMLQHHHNITFRNPHLSRD